MFGLLCISGPEASCLNKCACLVEFALAAVRGEKTTKTKQTKKVSAVGSEEHLFENSNVNKRKYEVPGPALSLGNSASDPPAPPTSIFIFTLIVQDNY